MKNKGGRPRIEIDKDRLDKLCSMPTLVMTNEDIAWLMGVSEDTVARYLKKESGLGFAEYRVKKQATLRQVIFAKQMELVLKGDKTMLIWMGKNYLSQGDTMHIDHSGQVNTGREKVQEVCDEIRVMISEFQSQSSTNTPTEQECPSKPSLGLLAAQRPH